MTPTENTEQDIIHLYNEVDAFLRQQYKQDRYAAHTFLIQELATSNRIINRYQQEMRAIAQLRNSLVHNPFPNAQPIATPNPRIVERYAEIRDALITPHKALSIAIPASQIFSATLQSNFAEVLRLMDKNTYTHVPIIEDDKMIGIFSENTLLSYFAESGETIVTDDMTIADFAEFLPLKSHRSECFKFLHAKASLGEVFDLFNKAIVQHKRVGMVFITEHGKETEKPLGMITAWDLASPELDLN